MIRVPLLVSECLNLSFLMWNVDGKILPFNLLSLTPIKAQGQRHPPKSIWFDFKVRKFAWNCVFVRFFSDLDPAEKLKELKSDAAARFRFFKKIIIKKRFCFTFNLLFERNSRRVATEKNCKLEQRVKNNWATLQRAGRRFDLCYRVT